VQIRPPDATSNPGLPQGLRGQPRSHNLASTETSVVYAGRNSHCSPIQSDSETPSRRASHVRRRRRTQARHRPVVPCKGRSSEVTRHPQLTLLGRCTRPIQIKNAEPRLGFDLRTRWDPFHRIKVAAERPAYIGAPFAALLSNPSEAIRTFGT
jgi:hypothetical protein